MKEGAAVSYQIRYDWTNHYRHCIYYDQASGNVPASKYKSGEEVFLD